MVEHGVQMVGRDVQMVERVKSYAKKTREKKEGGLGWELGSPSLFPPLSPLVFFPVNFSPALYYLNAWNRLRRSQKNTCFYENSSALCTSCITLFRTFLWRPLHDYDVKPPNARASKYEDKFETPYPFSFWNWIKSLRVQLQEKAPAFDKLSGSK